MQVFDLESKPVRQQIRILMKLFDYKKKVDVNKGGERKIYSGYECNFRRSCLKCEVPVCS